MSRVTNQFQVAALRNGVVVRTLRHYDTPINVTSAAVVEMLNLGFKVEFDDLKGMSTSALEQMLANARTVMGTDRDLTPVYPGFPEQVRGMDTITLIVEQLLHYYTAGAFLPDYPDVVRKDLPLMDMVRNARETRVLIAKEASWAFIHELTTRGVAFSDADRELLEASVELARPWLEDIANVLTDAVNGENMGALVASVNKVYNMDPNALLKTVIPTAKNVDQLLRFVLAVATEPVLDREEGYARAVGHLSDRDAGTVLMRTISRPTRRMVLMQLGKLSQGYNADRLVSRKRLWRRVMRMIHPYSFPEVGKNKDVRVRRAVDVIHDNVPYRTLNSTIETAMAEGDVIQVATLLGKYQPGNLLRRLVALLRLVSSPDQVDVLADVVGRSESTVSTLVSAYNGVLSINDGRARLTRVAGHNNRLVAADERLVEEKYASQVLEALKAALRNVLANKPAPVEDVGIVSTQAMPLVRRDLATTDKAMERGEVLTPVGEGDTIRLFSHWVNNVSDQGGYIDLGAVVLDKDFEVLNTVTWNSWHGAREWSTYSGDKFVTGGDSAAEYIDVDIPKLREFYPTAHWVAIALQSWSGFPLDKVDMIAGVMLRSEPDSGEPFDARTVTTAFKPTTEALQAIPLTVNLLTGEMVWIDTSSGSTEKGVSAASDESVGVVVYNEVARPRITMGEVAALWATAHGAATVDKPVDKAAVLALLN